MIKTIPASTLKVGDTCAIAGYVASQVSVSQSNGNVFVVWLLCGRTIETYYSLTDTLGIEETPAK